MWIANKNDWDESHTPLSKYFIEKIKQQVDFQETISNQHKSTNGFTLIKEIIDVSQLAIKREKSINRLVSLINEAKSEILYSSIPNDYILSNYYPDIVDYYININTNKLKENQKNVVDLLNKSLINYIRLENSYFKDLMTEISAIDFSSNEFVRNADKIDKIISSTVPYLLHTGYSITSISDISYRLIGKKNGDKSPKRIYNNFKSRKISFEFIIKTLPDGIEVKTICDYLARKGVDYKIIKNYDEVGEKFLTNIHSEGAVYLQIINSTIDPHNYLRNLYEVSLRKYVISKSRQDLSPLNDFFERIYWRFANETSHKFEKSNFNLDPLNVSKRKCTLNETLIKLSRNHNFVFEEDSEIPYIKEISDSIYYYNLAIGSKSIENSMSLLWTSLEILLPYRFKENDISNVQYFVSKSLSIGAVGREFFSFVRRFNDSNWINSGSLDSIGIFTSYINYDERGIMTYFNFLAKEYEQDNDPFNTLVNCSQLLANNFCKINDIYTSKNNDTVDYWLKKIEHSEQSIAFQLDRIYLHRNQIVHSGKFVNEYSNLWNHLEWYVGKLLSYCVIEYFKIENKENFNKKEIFINLEAHVDNAKNLMILNRDKKIKDCNNVAREVLKSVWQFF